MKFQMRYDQKIFRILGSLADVFLLGLCWIICSLPIFTMGCATASVYHAAHKCIIHDGGSATKEYFAFFKKNFKLITPAWLLWVVVAGFLVADLFLTRSFSQQAEGWSTFYYFFLVLAAAVVMWGFYLTAYMARFEGKTFESLKKALFMMIAHPLVSLLLLAIFVLFVYICNDMQFLIFLFPGTFALIKCKLLERVFAKYRSEDDIKEEQSNRHTCND